MSIRGVIFDLDGTLVDSGLDFELMRREMRLPAGPPLLEAIAELPAGDAQRCWAILAEHERQGVLRSTLLPGVRQFVSELAARNIVQAIVTRNSRVSTLATLARFDLQFDPVVCREDGPVKPDPSSIWKICKAWGFESSECVIIGDYRFDIEAGQRAGVQSVHFTGSRPREPEHDGWGCDFILPSFVHPEALWRWFEQIALEAPKRSC